MQEALLINPRDSRGRFLKRRRHVNARRRRHRASSRVRAINPARRRRRNPIAAIAANPRRRRRRHNPIAFVAANPRRRHRRSRIRAINPRRRRRHNPRFSPKGILNALVPAGIGAGGALALDVALNYVPLPAQLQSPWAKNAVKIAGAFAIGYVAKIALGNEKAKVVTLGALTVTAYSILRGLLSQYVPQLGLSGAETYDYSDLRLGYVNPAPMVTGAYMPNSGSATPANVGAYMRGGGLDNVNSLNGVVNDGM